MKLKLHIWRQKNARDKGKMVTYEVDGIISDMSFLEMLDVLNEKLILNSEEPVAFDNKVERIAGLDHAAFCRGLALVSGAGGQPVVPDRAPVSAAGGWRLAGAH